MPDNGDWVRIFDTTLRDGEQSPGATMTSAEKLEVARQLAVLGIDIMEAGFPAASPDDLQGVRRIAREVGKGDGPVIAGLARCWREDIDKAWQGVRDAAKPRIHTFIATSDLHMDRKLGMTREQVLSQVGHMVAHARSLCDDVEFSPRACPCMSTCWSRAAFTSSRRWTSRAFPQKASASLSSQHHRCGYGAPRARQYVP